MNKAYVEIGAFVLVALLSASLFASVPRQYPRYSSFEFTLGAENAIRAGGSPDPFYEITLYSYFALGGRAGALDRGIFDIVVKYLPVLLGVVCTVAVYAAVRARLGVEMGILGAIFLASSSPFVSNAATGTYAPEILGVTLFCMSLAIFLSADIAKNAVFGACLSLAAGLLLGWSMTATEAGLLLASAMIAAAAVQFVYYAREKDYRAYGIRLAALIIPVAAFFPYAKTANLSENLQLDTLISAYALLIPLIALFAFVAIRDLVREVKRYELFFLALAVGSVGIALFDTAAAAPGMSVGAIFGAAVAREHLREKWLSILFIWLACSFGTFLFMGSLVSFESSLALSLLVGGMAAMILILYEGENQRRLAVFAVIALIAATSLLHGIVKSQMDYVSVGPGLGEALNWSESALPDGAAVALIGPKGLIEYASGKRGCCEPELARYLLGSGSTAELKGAGAQYVLTDISYFDNVKNIANAGNVSTIGVAEYLFAGYSQDANQKFYANLVSEGRDLMLIPLDENGFPLKGDVRVDSIGSIPYGRIRRFEKEDVPLGPGSKVALPLYGDRNNLFDVYFEAPNGLELVFSTREGNVRVYKVL